MKNIAVACHTLKDEVELVAKDLQVSYPIIWVDSGLHNVPKKLKETLQNQIDKIANVDNIVLLFGSCGNSLLGITSSNARLVFPKVDDCISLFLGGNEQRRVMDREAPSYYLTKGYFESETSIWTEYSYCVKKYGPQKTKIIFDKLLNKYEKLRVIDTGAYEPEEIMESTLKMARVLGLDHETITGSLRIIYKAFKGEWDEEFVIVEPGQSISLFDLGLGQAVLK
ncbi:MAG: hypothetical protein PWQ96_1729 [Clostridia bacterium]|jgi:hypothetical protein|nr:hypothetical protein [Clostridiales bacterium]MDK2986085.1 hypothetical protein [Clostridia bacterium]